MEQIKRQRLSASAWRGVLARFARSGLTVQAFCQHESVSAASFYRWRSRLETPAAGGQEGSVASSPTAEFVDLGPLRSAANSRLELRLDLGGGVLLHLVRG